MKKITIIEARQILKCLLVADNQYLDKLAQTNDDELLKTDVRKAFNLDLNSLDLAAIDISLRRLYGIKLVYAKHSPFYYEPTVENFIKTVNAYGIQI